jgi:hypothetical protein
VVVIVVAAAEVLGVLAVSLAELEAAIIVLAVEKQTQWFQSASKLYRSNDRRLSAKLVLTFGYGGVSRSQRNGSLRPYSRFSRPEVLAVVTILALVLAVENRSYSSSSRWW